MVSVWLLGLLITISGHRNSFQCAVTETMAKAIRPGLAIGSSTYQMIAHHGAPSMAAASSKSRGKARKVWRIRKVPKAEAKYGAITPGSVS